MDRKDKTPQRNARNGFLGRKIKKERWEGEEDKDREIDGRDRGRESERDRPQHGRHEALEQFWQQDKFA